MKSSTNISTKLGKTIVACLFCLVFGEISFAANTFQTLTSFKIRTWSSGVHIFPISPAAINPDGCDNSNSYVLASTYTTELMHNVLMAALANGDSITIALENCSAGRFATPTSGRPRVEGVWVEIRQKRSVDFKPI